MSKPQSYFSIYQLPWWLEASSPGSWQEVEVVQDGQTIARMPFVYETRKLGLKYISMPHFAQTTGPWLRDSEKSRTSARLSEHKKLVGNLLDQLPEFDYFCHGLDYSLDNWLPFYWRGFSQTTYYTYVIEDISDPDFVLSQFDTRKRGDVKKAKQQVQVDTNMSIEEYYEHHSKSLRKKGQDISYSLEILQRIYTGALENNAGKIFRSVDSHGVVHAAVFMVWTEKVSYLLSTSIDPEYRDSASLSLLIIEAIKYCSSRSRKFDFHGSIIESVEHSYRGFGGEQKAYSLVTKSSPRMQLLQTTKRIFPQLKAVISR